MVGALPQLLQPYDAFWQFMSELCLPNVTCGGQFKVLVGAGGMGAGHLVAS